MHVILLQYRAEFFKRYHLVTGFEALVGKEPSLAQIKLGRLRRQVLQ